MRISAAAIGLALALTLTGITGADDSPRPATTASKSDAPKAAPTVNRAQVRAAKKAKADWERRTEVCLKLRGIAMETGDDELLRKVERLEERAWDVYLAALNGAPETQTAAPPSDGKKEGRK